MQCVSNEKLKCSKYFIFLVTMATKVGGVARYEKAYFLAFLNYYSHSPSVHRGIYSYW